MKALLALSLTAATLIASLTTTFADAAKAPAVGEAAPLVEGKNQDGKNWKLSDDIGKKVVLRCCLT
jgi:hypothetical protein